MKRTAAERGKGEKPLLVELGGRVRALRRERQLTLRALAEGSGLSERFVSDLESGRANLSVLSLAEVARALGVTPAALLGGGSEPKKEDPRKVIALLGLRGAGKSTVGRVLGQRLGLPFLELDRLVEVEAGMSLSELFAIHGEEYFRRLELEVLRRTLQQDRRVVLATGGGLVASPEAFALLREEARTVWLKATPEEHWQRVVRQGDLRPMRNRPHAMVELKRRLREREPWYAKAEISCSTSGRSVEAVVEEIARWVVAPTYDPRS